MPTTLDVVEEPLAPFLMAAAEAGRARLAAGVGVKDRPRRPSGLRLRLTGAWGSHGRVLFATHLGLESEMEDAFGPYTELVACLEEVVAPVAVDGVQVGFLSTYTRAEDGGRAIRVLIALDDGLEEPTVDLLTRSLRSEPLHLRCKVTDGHWSPDRAEFTVTGLGLHGARVEFSATPRGLPVE